MADGTMAAFFQMALLTHVVAAAAHPDFRMEELVTQAASKALLNVG